MEHWMALGIWLDELRYHALVGVGWLRNPFVKSGRDVIVLAKNVKHSVYAEIE